jgi:hypothetical protein
MFFNRSALFSGEMLILTPNASNTSADPHLLDALRFPCFATGIPAAAVMRAAAVEILNVLAWSPPVPTISSASTSWRRRIQWERIPEADAVISSVVSPFRLSAVRYALICTGDASPVIISSMTAFAVS